MNDTIMATIAAIKRGDITPPSPAEPEFQSVRSCEAPRAPQHALLLGKPVKLSVKLDIEPEVLDFFERPGSPAKETIQRILRRYVDGKK